MNRFLALASLAMLLTFAGCGGGDSHTSLAGETQSTMTEFVATLETVKDDASAKAAKPKLKALNDKLDDINKRMAKLPAPTDAEVKAMGDKYDKQMEDVAMKLQQNMLRIAFDPKIMAELGDLDVKKPTR